jgi:Uma2 family endonuclease
MANGHTIIPLDDSELAKSSLKYVNDRLVYDREDLPKGRFPTLSELRKVIIESGYELEETHDWYVTSDDDFTEIWFSDGARPEHQSKKIWFRRGSIIILDIMQKLANQCGSFLVVDHSGAVAVLIVPDSVFDISDPTQDGYVSTINKRIPIIVERLKNASVEDALFLMSQIHQAIASLYMVQQHEFYQTIREGLPIFAQFLTHSDVRLRFLAFVLVSTWQQDLYDYADVLNKTMSSEPEPDTKARMIWAIKEHVKGDSAGRLSSWTQNLRDTLLKLVDDDQEVQFVRLAAANLIARTKLGFLTLTIQNLFVNALVQPEQYTANWDAFYSVNESVLESLTHVLLHQRIAILQQALPQIVYAQDAHTVLRTLLDNVFYGETRNTSMSSLLQEQVAERPDRGETKFRDSLSINWSYPINPQKVSVSELTPFQVKILDFVLSLETPWMVHSNLLQKYGLPATRSEVRNMLISYKMSPTSWQHGKVEFRLAAIFSRYQDEHETGEFVTGEVGFYTRGDQFTTRAADIAFIQSDRIPEKTQGFLSIAPDLVVEIIPPGNSADDIEAKTVEWFDFGVKMVWLIYPRTERVHVFTTPKTMRVYSADETLTTEDVLPGFSVSVAEIFT